MKLNRRFIYHYIAGEHVVVSSDTNLFSGMVRCNNAAAFVVECLKTENSIEEIAQKVCERFDVDYETAAQDTSSVVEKLRSIGAIDD